MAAGRAEQGGAFDPGLGALDVGGKIVGGAGEVVGDGNAGDVQPTVQAVAFDGQQGGPVH